MNIVLLVIDSLRAKSLRAYGAAHAQTPFLDRLGQEALWFRRAYAAECWTLPSHVSMFTGRLASEHGAHFQTMAYDEPAPTIAEILTAAGYHTELVTRNFIFDGTVPGVTRGFQVRTRHLAALGRIDPLAVLLTLMKPRVRRHVRATGFFHPRHSEQREFVGTFARSLLPADEPALARVLDVMQRQRRAGRPYFLFCNLYDVHAPYPPRSGAILRKWRARGGVSDRLTCLLYLSRLGQHAYLREGFRMPVWAQQVLLDRYHLAIELMDAKLAAFYAAARSGGLLADTLLIITSDHGEAFGEHGLYLHDASVYDTHLRVPLWIVHPGHEPAAIDDVVSTRDLFQVMLAAAGQRPVAETMLETDFRQAQPIAWAEHFFYPQCPDAAPRYRQNLMAAIVGTEKYVVRRKNVVRYDLLRDPDEVAGEPASIEELIATCRRTGMPNATIDAAAARFRNWRECSDHRTAFRCAA